MKNIIKRVSAFAMAFALLGAGSTVAKNVSPKSDTTITANAISYASIWRRRDTFHDVSVYQYDGNLHRYYANGPYEYGTISIGYNIKNGRLVPIETIMIETWSTASGSTQRTSVRLVDAYNWHIYW